MNTKIVGFVDDMEPLRDIYEAYFSRYFTVVTYPGFRKVPNFMDCNFWVFDNDTKEDIRGIDMIQNIKNSILVSGEGETFKEQYPNLADRIFQKNNGYKDILAYINNFFAGLDNE